MEAREQPCNTASEETFCASKERQGLLYWRAEVFDRLDLGEATVNQRGPQCCG
jgi:hypothetical protein